MLALLHSDICLRVNSGADGVGESSLIVISSCAWPHRANTIAEAKRQTTRRIA